MIEPTNLKKIDCGDKLARTEYFAYHDFFHLAEKESTENLDILNFEFTAIAIKDANGLNEHKRVYTCKINVLSFLKFVEANREKYLVAKDTLHKKFYLSFANKFITSKIYNNE